MEKYQEYLSVGTYDGAIIEGTALLYNKSRLSELFNDVTSRFIVMDDTKDDTGRKNERIFLNKDMIIWAAPKEVKHSSNNALFGATEYVEVFIKTIKNIIIEGRINLQVFDNMFDMLRYTGAAPFIVLINARDTNGELHHTLFVNKAAIIHIECSAS
ncbi:MAG: hypothetical protein CVU61_10985 [Deltaproteobacteria bacterium HGW-Deltaproteobacteria-19]|jgi:hypothetical protein|nr:MAG: hypothetical protein CVU61_10985 [Deltaproteobacteria bacterium HGW-Deltaproteobacteria-19]